MLYTKKYFIYIVVGMFLCLCHVLPVYADDVCVSGDAAVDIITLLDASERDLQLLDSCNKLV